MDQAEAEYLARLVHKGFLAEADARRALAEIRTGESVADLLGRLGLMEPGEAARLCANKVGEEPQLTRYEIRRRLGEGGTALVFEALDRRTNEIVALKVLREEVARVPAKLRRFVEEAQLLCSLRHQNLVGGHRVARDKGSVFLAMELLPGETLEERLLRGERFAESEALRIVHQVAKVLAYLREQGFVHRDLKPGNLILSPNGRVHLIDLGFAAQIGDVEGGTTTVGTVEYIAPEQARGEGGLDSRADIYSLGATLYHLVVGEPPFAGDDNQEILIKQVMAELSSEKIKELDLSPTLHYFIEKMMAKDKAIRYQDPDEVVQDLEEKLGEQLAPDHAPGGRARGVRTTPRHRRGASGARRARRRR